MKDAAPPLVTRILEAYGISYRRTLPPQKGYRNTSYPFEMSDGSRMNLILYKEEPGMLARIRRMNGISDYLRNREFPARRCQGPLLRMTDGNRSRYAALYDYLPGETIAWEAYGKDHIKLLGKSMSTMHALVQDYAPSRNLELPQVIDDSEALLERMGQYFGQKGVQTALHDKLGLRVLPTRLLGFKTLLDACRQLPDSQPLHMDFVRGNVLFSSKRVGSERWLFLDDPHKSPYISGILDFEKSAFGPPVFDIARTLAFLLVDCKYKQPLKVVKYFVRSGYQKRGGHRLDDRQLRVLMSLSRFYMLHDFYKFLRHNPYESLLQNEHFARTRDFLLKDGIIESTTRPATGSHSNTGRS